MVAAKPIPKSLTRWERWVYSTRYISNILAATNNHPLITGVLVVIVNLASRYAPMRVSKTVENFFKYSLSRYVVIFAVVWFATRQTLITLVISTLLYLLFEYALNEDSPWCLLDKTTREYYTNLSDVEKPQSSSNSPPPPPPPPSRKELEDAQRVLTQTLTYMNTMQQIPA